MGEAGKPHDILDGAADPITNVEATPLAGPSGRGSADERGRSAHENGSPKRLKWREVLTWCLPASRGRTRRFPETLEFVGAGEGIRTLDPDLGKVVLYP